MTTTPLYFFSVSKLSHAEICIKRSKLEIFSHYGGSGKSSQYTVTGDKLHYQYSYSNKGFDRLRVKLHFKGQKLRKQVSNTNIVVIGVFDDLRVLLYNTLKYTSLIELKTTSKKFMWGYEIAAAVKQLQLYMWLMKDELAKFGFPLWKRSYVEVYSQRTGEMIRRIPVEYDEHIEDWIVDVVEKFKGLRLVRVPDLKICKFCPRTIKVYCSWYQGRRERGKQRRCYGEGL